MEENRYYKKGNPLEQKITKKLSITVLLLGMIFGVFLHVSSYLYFLIGTILIIAIHELGHYLYARYFGLRGEFAFTPGGVGIFFRELPPRGTYLAGFGLSVVPAIIWLYLLSNQMWYSIVSGLIISVCFALFDFVMYMKYEELKALDEDEKKHR